MKFKLKSKITHISSAGFVIFICIVAWLILTWSQSFKYLDDELNTLRAKNSYRLQLVEVTGKIRELQKSINAYKTSLSDQTIELIRLLHLDITGDLNNILLVTKAEENKIILNKMIMHVKNHASNFNKINNYKIIQNELTHNVLNSHTDRLIEYYKRHSAGNPNLRLGAIQIIDELIVNYNELSNYAFLSNYSRFTYVESNFNYLVDLTEQFDRKLTNPYDSELMNDYKTIINRIIFNNKKYLSLTSNTLSGISNEMLYLTNNLSKISNSDLSDLSKKIDLSLSALGSASVILSTILLIICSLLFIGMLRLIIKQRISKDTIQQHLNRYKAAFDQAAIGFAEVGLDGTWEEVNIKLCDIVGYKRNELIGSSFQKITHPEDLNTFK